MRVLLPLFIIESLNFNTCRKLKQLISVRAVDMKVQSGLASVPVASNGTHLLKN
jgi:hypothetical protein